MNTNCKSAEMNFEISTYSGERVKVSLLSCMEIVSVMLCTLAWLIGLLIVRLGKTNISPCLVIISVGTKMHLQCENVPLNLKLTTL